MARRTAPAFDKMLFVLLDLALGAGGTAPGASLLRLLPEPAAGLQAGLVGVVIGHPQLPARWPGPTT